MSVNLDPQRDIRSSSTQNFEKAIIPNLREAVIEESFNSWFPDSRPINNIYSAFHHYQQLGIRDVLTEYNKRIPVCSNDATDVGAIAKIDLPKDSNIFVHADFHGNFEEFISLLNIAKNYGYLDENFQVQPNFKDRIYFVFLGDYLDRGLHSIKLLKLLIIFKMQNPDQVFLLQGNHEWMHKNDEENFYGMLSHFNRTLFLSLYVGVYDNFGHRNYIQFSHGGIELDYDPQPLLSQNSEPGQILYETISKFKPFFFSERAETVIHSCKEVAQRIDSYVQPFFFNNLETLELGRINGGSALNWDDLGIVSNDKYIDFSIREGVYLYNTSPLAVHDYQYISSSENNRVVFNIVGHQHINKEIKLNHEVIALILGSSFHAQLKVDHPEINNSNEPEDEIAFIDCNSMTLSRIRIPYDPSNCTFSDSSMKIDSHPALDRCYYLNTFSIPQESTDGLFTDPSEAATSMDVSLNPS